MGRGTCILWADTITKIIKLSYFSSNLLNSLSNLKFMSYNDSGSRRYCYKVQLFSVQYSTASSNCACFFLLSFTNVFSCHKDWWEHFLGLCNFIFGNILKKKNYVSETNEWNWAAVKEDINNLAPPHHRRIGKWEIIGENIFSFHIN